VAELPRDDELRRLELRVEREEEDERESRDVRDRERREPLSESSSLSKSSSSSSRIERDELLRELEREEDEPNESPLRDERCAEAGSTLQTASAHAAKTINRNKNSGLRRLDSIFPAALGRLSVPAIAPPRGRFEGIPDDREEGTPSAS